ncbi:glycosyltransferase family 9 protein [Ekhidna sp.]|uniref:glycosyltransferase family 9 protein n=1 Tax=Ekhidna sp. TaxID=2608089 RepID=UPI003CCBAD8D
MNILLIQSGSLENALLITPIIRSLKTELDAKIHLLSDGNHRVLFEENPYLDHFHQLEQGKKAIKGLEFEWVFDFHNSLKTKIIRLGVGKNTKAFKSQKFRQWLYSKTKINLLSKKHLVDRYFDLIAPLGAKPDQLGLDFYIPEKDEVEKDWLPGSHHEGYAAVVLSASHSTRKLPVNRLIELCDRINKPIVLIGNKDDTSQANEIEAFFKRGTEAEEEAIENLNKNAIIFNACGKFNFNQSASLINQANWVFSHDNVMMHIAASFKKKLYTIWGNTTPLFGKYPYRAQFTIFENNKLRCRPCSSKGFTNCPKGHFKCMNDLTFDFYLPD